MELFVGGIAIVFLLSALAGGKYILYKCNSLQEEENVYIIRENEENEVQIFDRNEIPPKYEEIYDL